MTLTFPTLSKEPDLSNYTEESAVDPTIRTEFENGRVLTRAKFTNVSKKWTISYSYLTNSDKDLLKEFEEKIHFGALSFYWTSPADSTTYEVRFQKTLKIVAENQIINGENKWSLTFDVAEIRPHSDESIS